MQILGHARISVTRLASLEAYEDRGLPGAEALAADHDFRVVPGMPGRRRLASAAFATFLRRRSLLADLAAHRIGDILVPGGYHDHPGDDLGQLDVRGADRGCVAGTPEVQD
jgi:hypothetical protein